MYRGITYDYSKSNVKLFTWNKEGKRITRDFHYKPYFFTETSNKTEYKSIFDGNLKKHEFDNEFDRRKTIKTSGNDRIYGNLPVEQQFLIDAFGKVCKKEGFSQYPLSFYYIDIEVYSPDEFPDAWEAKHPVNVITIYNSLKNHFRVFCLDRPFDPNNLNQENKERFKKITDVSSVKMTYHCNEKELLNTFINYWIRDYPDIITGWNLPFDIPYLVNRIKTKLSNKDAMRLSPIRKVREIERQQKMGAQYSQPVKDYLLDGITTLDYHDVYMKFNMKPIPNRKLDTVLGIELGVGKVKFESANLAKLSEDDWDLFVFYNIEDVNGLKLLEEKLKFLQTCRTISYMGLVPMKKSLDTLPIINGYSAVNALEEEKIIPTFEKNNNWRKFDGAYVKEPTPGIYEDVVSFDLNSLYPMTIITLNMSPETKFGRARFVGKDVIVEDNVGKETRMTKENFDKLLEKTNLAISKSNVLFTQNKKGIFPKLVEEVYSNRVKVKGKIKQLRKEGEENNKNEIERLTAYQNALKVCLNSLYGYCGNRYAQMSDIDIAESVTMTCQEVIKESSNITNNIIAGIVKEEGEYISYNDTDSLYSTVNQILTKYNINFFNEDKSKVNPKVVKLCEKIEDKLNQSIKAWGEKELNSKDCRFEFKMEAIADKAFFIAKKNYVVHVMNDEGIDITNEEKRWKYKGIKLVSASMAEETKPLVEQVLRNIVMNNKKSESDKIYMQAYEDFENLDYNSIAIIKSLNKLDEYVANCDGWNVAPRMQAHYRGAYYYNKLLDDLHIANNYEKIRQGDKVKFVYLKNNNKYGINVISYVDTYPKEFESIFELDKEMMFEKCVKDVVNQFYKALNWNLFSPNYQPVIDIGDEFFE